MGNCSQNIHLNKGRDTARKVLLPVASLSSPFPLPFSFSAVWQAEKDKILKLSAEILRLEKAVQEEKTQNQVFKTELAREKDSSLVRLAATHSRVLRPPAAASHLVLPWAWLSSARCSLPCGVASSLHRAHSSLV